MCVDVDTYVSTCVMYIHTYECVLCAHRLRHDEVCVNTNMIAMLVLITIDVSCMDK